MSKKDKTKEENKKYDFKEDIPVPKDVLNACSSLFRCGDPEKTAEYDFFVLFLPDRMHPALNREVQAARRPGLIRWLFYSYVRSSDLPISPAEEYDQYIKVLEDVRNQIQMYPNANLCTDHAFTWSKQRVREFARKAAAVVKRRENLVKTAPKGSQTAIRHKEVLELWKDIMNLSHQLAYTIECRN